jgi:hypothetical protein
LGGRAVGEGGGEREREDESGVGGAGGKEEGRKGRGGGERKGGWGGEKEKGVGGGCDLDEVVDDDDVLALGVAVLDRHDALVPVPHLRRRRRRRRRASATATAASRLPRLRRRRRRSISLGIVDLLFLSALAFVDSRLQLARPPSSPSRSCRGSAGGDAGLREAPPLAPPIGGNRAGGARVACRLMSPKRTKRLPGLIFNAN